MKRIGIAAASMLGLVGFTSGGHQSIPESPRLGEGSTSTRTLAADPAHTVRVRELTGQLGGSSAAIAPPAAGCPCAGSPLEGEANCGLPTDTFNGGCNSSPPVFSAIALGGSVCGTGAWDGTARDTDCYQFSLPYPCTVTWTVTAEYPVVTALLDNTCPANILDFDAGGPCMTTSSTALLPAGTYVAFTAPDFGGSPFLCGGANTYLGTLTCDPHPACPCAGSPLEGEANCGIPTDTVDGGCNSSPPVFGALAVGGSVCGTAAWDGTVRDTDCYSFSLASPCTITWTVTAEYPVVIALLDNVCPANIIAFTSGDPCIATSLSAYLPAGSYVAFTAPDFSGPLLVCGVDNTYLGTLTCDPHPNCPCAGSPSEGEADCGIPVDTFNGGCNSSPVVFSSIAPGGSVCGTAAWDETVRDTDCYQFTLASPCIIKWTVTAEYPVVTAILDNNCPAGIIDFDSGGPCVATSSSSLLPAGTYIAFTAPDFDGPAVYCGGGNTYLGTLTCQPPLKRPDSPARIGPPEHRSALIRAKR